MNVGDKVRLLHGKEEGKITKILKGGEVEVEIEEGFRIPALKSEVVLIDARESAYFGAPQIEEKDWLPKPKKQSVAEDVGIFLAFIPFNDHNHGVYFINNSKKDVVYAVSEVHGGNSVSLGAGVAKAESQHMLEEKSIKTFDSWPALSCQVIPINARLSITEKPFERKLAFKASSFFKSKGTAPVLKKSGYVIRLDQFVGELDVRQLNQELNPQIPPPQAQFPRPPKEVDLHIEKLTPDHDFLSNTEKLKVQLEAFEKNLNYAIASGMDEITFIHGIGNGVLRKEIHRHLSLLVNISYFKDTHKSNFGYGATLVKIHE